MDPRDILSAYTSLQGNALNAANNSYAVNTQALMSTFNSIAESINRSARLKQEVKLAQEERESKEQISSKELAARLSEAAVNKELNLLKLQLDEKLGLSQIESDKERLKVLQNELDLRRQDAESERVYRKDILSLRREELVDEKINREKQYDLAKETLGYNQYQDLLRSLNDQERLNLDAERLGIERLRSDRDEKRAIVEDELNKNRLDIARQEVEYTPRKLALEEERIKRALTAEKLNTASKVYEQTGDPGVLNSVYKEAGIDYQIDPNKISDVKSIVDTYLNTGNTGDLADSILRLPPNKQSIALQTALGANNQKFSDARQAEGILERTLRDTDATPENKLSAIDQYLQAGNKITPNIESIKMSLQTEVQNTGLGDIDKLDVKQDNYGKIANVFQKLKYSGIDPRIYDQRVGLVLIQAQRQLQNERYNFANPKVKSKFISNILDLSKLKPEGHKVLIPPKPNEWSYKNKFYVTNQSEWSYGTKEELNKRIEELMGI